MGQFIRGYVALRERAGSLIRIISDDSVGLRAEILLKEGWLRDDAILDEVSASGAARRVSIEDAQEFALKLGLRL